MFRPRMWSNVTLGRGGGQKGGGHGEVVGEVGNWVLKANDHRRVNCFHLDSRTGVRVLLG